MTPLIDYNSFILGFLAGIIIGVIGSFFVSKQKLELSQKIALIVFVAWLGMHLWAFATNQSLSNIFDFVGLGATGHLIGIDVADSIRKVMSSKK